MKALNSLEANFDTQLTKLASSILFIYIQEYQRFQLEVLKINFLVKTYTNLWQLDNPRFETTPILQRRLCVKIAWNFLVFLACKIRSLGQEKQFFQRHRVGILCLILFQAPDGHFPLSVHGIPALNCFDSASLEFSCRFVRISPKDEQICTLSSPVSTSLAVNVRYHGGGRRK